MLDFVTEHLRFWSVITLQTFAQWTHNARKRPVSSNVNEKLPKICWRILQYHHLQFPHSWHAVTEDTANTTLNPTMNIMSVLFFCKDQRHNNGGKRDFWHWCSPMLRHRPSNTSFTSTEMAFGSPEHWCYSLTHWCCRLTEKRHEWWHCWGWGWHWNTGVGSVHADAGGHQVHWVQSPTVHNPANHQLPCAGNCATFVQQLCH